MKNKDKLNLGLIALVLIIVAFGVGFFANTGPQNMDLLANNSIDPSQGQSQGGGSPGGGGSPDGGNRVREDCPNCVNGEITVNRVVGCTTCGGRGRLDPNNDGVFDVDCPDCDGGRVTTTRTEPCTDCGGDGYLDQGDPGYCEL
ncbi:MAG: hypothetical protein FJ150_02600 [Euryarchaeota archaeon]|nr:hypothetical protein [Euryarchaeota archaeon]